MTLAEEYQLSEYDTLGPLEGHPHIQLVRSRITGRICVRKQVSAAQLPVYQFLQVHPDPYVPEIYACVEDGEDLIILEEYLTGRNLAEILQEGVFSEPEAAAVITALCRALRPLHQARIICRDLKAENVMRTEDGKIWLVDFDIARQYQPGQHRDTQLLGTAGYAAPEQFGFRQTDGRSDIYALGVLLNMLVTGNFPTEQLTAGRLQPVVLRCTELNPADRYQRVEDLEEDLRLHLSVSTPQNPGGFAGAAPQESANAYAPSAEHDTAAEEDSAKSSRSGHFSLLLPGFRSHTPWKIFLAVVLYLFLLWFWFSLPLKANGVYLSGLQLRLEQGLLWLANMVHICIIWNWNGLRDALPLVRSHWRICRLAGYCITGALLFVAAVFFCVIVDEFF